MCTHYFRFLPFCLSPSLSLSFSLSLPLSLAVSASRAHASSVSFLWCSRSLVSAARWRLCAVCRLTRSKTTKTTGTRQAPELQWRKQRGHREEEEKAGRINEREGQERDTNLEHLGNNPKMPLLGVNEKNKKEREIKVNVFTKIIAETKERVKRTEANERGNSNVNSVTSSSYRRD